MFLEAVWAENEALFGLCLIGYYLIKVLNLSAQKWPNVMLVFLADQLWLSTFPLALTLMYHAYAPHQHPSRVWLASERSPWRYRANTDLSSSAGGCGEESRENRSITTKIIKHQSKLNITTYLPLSYQPSYSITTAHTPPTKASNKKKNVLTLFWHRTPFKS